MSIRARLALLVLALAIPAGALAFAVAWGAYAEKRALAEQSVAATTRALGLAIDREIGKIEATARILASSSAFLNDDLAEFYGEALAATTPSQYVVLYDRERQVVNTRAAPGTPLPAVNNPEQLARVMDGRESFLSELFAGLVTDRWLFAYSVPVEVRGEVRYLLAVTFEPTLLTSVFEEQQLPASWAAAVIDRDGTIAARNVRAGEFVGRPAVPLLQAGVIGRERGMLHSETVDGTPVLTAFERSPAYGLTYAIGVPLAELNAIGRDALFGALAGAGLLLLGAIGLALLLANRIVRPIRALAQATESLGRGAPVLAPPPGIAEVDRAGEALLRTEAELAARAAARERDAALLRELNASLEARVAERTAELSAANRQIMLEMAERERTQDILRQAQKMEAVGQLTGGVAHDFNNLLQAVGGYLHLLHRRVQDPALRAHVESAQQALKRGSKLTGHLLAFARRQTLDARPTDLNAVIAGMSELLHRTLGGAVQVETALEPGLWPAHADAQQLELCLLNLALNARDAMPGGGTLRFATANVAPCHANVQGSFGQGECVQVVVADDGTGMDEQTLKRAFEPFFTTKPVGQGTGLGLSMVYGTIRQLGGDVTLESTPGAGTRVSLYLPRAAVRPAAARETVARADAGRVEVATATERLRVLVVDDDAEVRHVIVGMLRDAGHSVADAADGAAALAQLRAGGFDVLVSDYAMQGMKGDELCHEARALQPGLGVLLLTGYADAPRLAIESTALLRKPIGAQALAEAVRAAGRRAGERRDPRESNVFIPSG